MRKSTLFPLACVLAGSAAMAAAPPARPPITSVSHLSVYAGDAAKTERFYVHDLGAAKMADPENAQGTLLLLAHAICGGAAATRQRRP
jgi:hypothetical protein